MTHYETGDQVLIIEDCRDGHVATGQTGTYEGMHPHPDGGWENPRIRLENGTAIWGCECWWTPIEKAMPLEEEQATLEVHKAFLRWLFGMDKPKSAVRVYLERWAMRIRSLVIFPWWKRCENECGWVWPYGFVPECGCKVHDPDEDEG